MAVRLPKIRTGKVLDIIMGIMLKSRLFDVLRLFYSSSLTVLNYHRIGDPNRPDFDTFKPNVSATPEEFARQMDYVCSRYSVITCQELVEWLNGEISLPPRPLLITFDDGYYDNLKYVTPVLMERNLPAVIFLTTGFMGTKKPFYWGLCGISVLPCCKVNRTIAADGRSLLERSNFAREDYEFLDQYDQDDP